MMKNFNGTAKSAITRSMYLQCIAISSDCERNNTWDRVSVPASNVTMP